MLPANLHFENGSLGQLVIWILSGQDQLVQYQFQLMTRQPPPYLLPCLLRHRSGLPQFCQDISGLTPLDHIEPAAAKDPGFALAVLEDIVKSLLDAADHLLPPSQFSLDPSLIFLDQDKQVKLTFWPVIQGSSNEAGCCAQDAHAEEKPGSGLPDLQQLLTMIGRACSLPAEEVSQYQQCLADKGLPGLQAALGRVRASRLPVNQAERSSSQDSKTIGNTGQTIVRTVQQAWQLIWQWFMRLFRGQADTEDELENQTVMLGDPADFRMAMLSEGRPGTPEENEGVRAFILIDEFVIGRDSRNTDLCLADAAVGRMHARILRRAGSFFVCDLGSRNGTSLDGRRILKNTEILLPEKCVLKFAGHSFYFQVDGSI